MDDDLSHNTPLPSQMDFLNLRHTGNSLRYRGETFLGVFLDSGAERSVAEFDTAAAICRYIGVQFEIQPSATHFHFGIEYDSARERCHLSMLFSQTDVVRGDITVLLGLDVMSRCRLILYFDKEEPPPSWNVKIVYQIGHAFTMSPGSLRGVRKSGVAKWGCPNLSSWTLFHPGFYAHLSQADLTKLHLQFYYPSPLKLFLWENRR